MKIFPLFNKVWKVILDFLFGENSEVRYDYKKQKFTSHRPYRFIPRLRAKPQEKKH